MIKCKMLPFLLAAAIGPLVACSPGLAAWSHGSYTYTYGSEPASSSDNLIRVGGKLIAHEQITVGAGVAWVTLTAYGQTDALGNPIRVQRSLKAQSYENAKLPLVGAPPPPKPTMWMQRGYVTGTCSLRLHEEVSAMGPYTSSASARWGTPMVPPSECHASDGTTIGSDGSAGHDIRGGKQSAVTDPSYDSRQVSPNQWRNACLEAKVSVNTFFAEGTLVADSNCQAVNWGAQAQ